MCVVEDILLNLSRQRQQGSCFLCVWRRGREGSRNGIQEKVCSVLNIKKSKFLRIGARISSTWIRVNHSSNL